MPTRQIRCAQCGAPKDAEDDCLVVLCDYCGAFVAIASESYLDPARAMQPDAIERLLNPTEAEARWRDLAGEMASSAEAGDRDGWRRAAEEHYALLPLCQPEMVPSRFRQGEGLKEWVKATMGSAELIAFDPEIKAASVAMSVPTGELMAGGGVEAARAILEKAEDFHRRLFSHPDFPAEFLSPDADRQSKEHLRAVVDALSFQLGAETVERIKIEVLGDKVGATVCDGCGASIDDPSVGACPFCGGRIATSGDKGDQAFQMVLGTFRMSAAAIEDPDTLAMTALSFLLNVGPTMGWTPTVDSALDFLEQGAPKLDRKLLARTIQSMGSHMTDTPEGRELVAKLPGLLKR